MSLCCSSLLQLLGSPVRHHNVPDPLEALLPSHVSLASDSAMVDFLRSTGIPDLIRLFPLIFSFILVDDVHELHDMTVSSLPASCLGVRVRRSTTVNMYGYFILHTEYLLCMKYSVLGMRIPNSWIQPSLFSYLYIRYTTGLVHLLPTPLHHRTAREK